MPSVSVIRRRRYPSDCTEAEWALVLPLLPDPAWEAGKGGRPGKHCWRTVLDAIRYVVEEGITWRALPADFPPWSTIYKYFQRWQDQLVLDRLHEHLRDRVRMLDGRPPWPSAAIILRWLDRGSVADRGGLDGVTLERCAGGPLGAHGLTVRPGRQVERDRRRCERVGRLGRALNNPRHGRMPDAQVHRSGGADGAVRHGGDVGDPLPVRDEGQGGGRALQLAVRPP
jgi:transposase